MRALWLVAAALLGGCISDPAPQGEHSTPRTHAWGIDECAFTIAVVQVDPDALAARLPPGFALAPGRLSALPAGPRAAIELDAYRCARGVLLDGSVIEDVAYGSFYAAVVPPDALREEGYEAHFVKWDFLVPDDARRAFLAGAGLPAREGDATVAIAANAAGATVDAQLDLGNAGGFALTGAMQAPAPPGDPLPFMEFTPLDGGGLARWHARLHDASVGSGMGTITLRPGWVRDLVGSDTAPAQFIAGTWNLDEADVTFPIG